MNSSNPLAGAAPVEKPPGRHLLKHLGVGAGGAVENSFQNTPLGLANPIYNVGLGVSPVLIGFAMAIPRIWELFLDPVIGAVSDRTQSRYGRRLPYMAAGLLGSFIFFVAMWLVPAGWSKMSMGLWLIVTALLFYTCYSFFAIPYAALTIEETTAGPDRIGVMSARTAFANLSNIGINWLYWCCQRDWFASPVQGMRWVGFGFGFICFLCGAVVIATTLKSRHPLPPPASEPSREDKSCDGQKSSYREILGLKSTRCLLAALLSNMIGFTLVGNLGFYLVAFYACKGDLKQAALVTAVKATLATATAVVACPFIGAEAKRLGKDKVFHFMLLLGAVSSLSEWFLITPASPYLSMVSDLGIAISLVGFWLLMPAYLGDISDYYEAQTGRSCQGGLSALYGIAVKIGASLALLLTGYILVVCGFNSEMPLATMATPILKMRILFAVVPAFGLAFSYVTMRQFRFGGKQKTVAIP